MAQGERENLLHALAAAWSRMPPFYRFPSVAPSLEEAFAGCERLARSHYENFSVATWFLPKALHKHFFSIYAYCRIADDLGDESGGGVGALMLLDEWETALAGMYAHLLEPSAPAPRHPVFVALSQTVREFDIPMHEFGDLLTAFRQDQETTRYESFDELLGYCRYSANPVGHLILHLCRSADRERMLLSDYTCTALQLANFWQDVSVDWDKGRVYLPQEDLRRFGVSEQQIAERRFTPEFKALMQFEVERAREWFARGLPLIKKLDGVFALDIELFTRGGQAILDAIEARGYDVLSGRPEVGKMRKLRLAFQALAGRVLLGAHR